jgi:hypothetical protein
MSGLQYREGLCFLTFSLILLITLESILPNVLTSASATPHLAGVGDWGCSSNTKNTVKNIVNHAALTTLALGNNSYQSTGTCWYNIVKHLDGDSDANNPKRLNYNRQP